MSELAAFYKVNFIKWLSVIFPTVELKLMSKSTLPLQLDLFYFNFTFKFFDQSLLPEASLLVLVFLCSVLFICRITKPKVIPREMEKRQVGIGAQFLLHFSSTLLKYLSLGSFELHEQSKQTYSQWYLLTVTVMFCCHTTYRLPSARPERCLMTWANMCC